MTGINDTGILMSRFDSLANTPQLHQTIDKLRLYWHYCQLWSWSSDCKIARPDIKSE